MMLKFTQLTDKLKYPLHCKSKLLLYHSAVITYVISKFDGTSRTKRKIVDSLNILSYVAVSGDNCLQEWSLEDPLENLPDIGDDDVEHTLKPLGLLIKLADIEWDVAPTFQPSQMHVVSAESSGSKEQPIVPKTLPASNVHTLSETPIRPAKRSSPVQNKIASREGKDLMAADTTRPTKPLVLTDITPKEDLYIQHPLVPRLDINSVYACGKDGPDSLVIYTTLPEVPRRQSEISITTDISKMSNEDLMRLYPKQFIRTRADAMYTAIKDVRFHHTLGVVPTIAGFEEADVIDNIIQYPHLYQLMKNVDGKFVTFYATIEIDGVLHDIKDVWDDLPDAKKLPNTKEFMKEYVVRRYLLERDIKHIDHKYKMFGNLDPYLTLFTTPEDYKGFGYDDVVQLAVSCVKSRISFRSSRNPVLRRLQHV